MGKAAFGRWFACFFLASRDGVESLAGLAGETLNPKNTMAYNYDNPFVTVADAEADERQTFIRRTYLHLGAAILAFVLLETVLLHLPGIENLIGIMVGGIGWIITLVAFMAVSWIADKWAQSDASQGMQYLGLGLYVAAESIIFLPLLYVAAYRSGDPALIPMAGVITGLLFAGLTATAFMSGTDFSFLRGALIIGVSWPWAWSCAASSSGSRSGWSSPRRWCSSPPARSSTPRRTSFTTTAPISTWQPRSRCSPG